jgi:hypothetical protein
MADTMEATGRRANHVAVARIRLVAAVILGLLAILLTL